MSLNRFNRNGRDFLQENKQKVAHWEANGRLTAAAAAKRVNLWRPVVLHYAEKLRPHGQRHLRNRHYVAPHESSKMHSGLSHPYGFQQDERLGHMVNRPCRQIKQHRGGLRDEEKMRQGGGDNGGYSDRLIKQQKPQQQQMTQTQTQTEEIKDSRFLKKALDKCEQQSPQSPSPSRTQTQPQPQPQPQPQAKQQHQQQQQQQQSEQSDQADQTQLLLKKPSDHIDDDALSVYSFKSKASQRSNISKISKKSQQLLDNDDNPDTPLSARSNTSLKTIRSTATVRSSCSNKSHATVKSEESVKSQATIKSHTSNKSNATIKSHVSEKSNASIRSEISKASVRSEKSQASVRSEKSQASVRTEKSQASVRSEKSQASVRTEKSQASVRTEKSQASVRSEKSQASVRSEKSQASVRSERSRPKGGESSAMNEYKQMQNERQAALNDAHFKYSKLIDEYNHLPVSEPTLRVRNRKSAIERELDQLDYAINMYDNSHMYYKP